MKKSAILIAAFSAVVVLGVARAGPSGGQPLFERFKAVESMSHRERVRILEEAERCIRSAQDRRAYRECERREHDARQALREATRKDRQALRAEIEARRAARGGPEARL